jgi:hypothetical protein
MDALDGNAIAGLLYAVYGHEMTTATGTCAQCRTTNMLAEAAVYLRAPGAVARCRNCDNVLMVLVEARGITCVDARGLEALEPTTNQP